MYKYIFVFIVALFLVSCNVKPDVPSLTMEKFVEKKDADSNLIILDVRTPKELVGPLGKLENVKNIPVQELSGRVEELEKYRDKTIAVICRTGNRSTFATKILIDNGYDAYDVLGGMKEYRSNYGDKN